MIIRVSHPDQLTRIIPEVTSLFGDFLARAKEPFSVADQWAAVLRGLASDRFLFLVVVDDKVKPVGYLLAQAGFDFWQVPYANVIQVYAKPGAMGFLQSLSDAFDEWAKGQGALVASALTHRAGGAYSKWIAKFGFEPNAAMYVKLLGGTDRGETAED